MRVFAARRDDVSEGFVWLRRNGLPSRCVVRIKNPSTASVVYCEALQMDDNFVTEYNNDKDSRRFKISAPDDAIVMSGWFRFRLGDLATQGDYALRSRNHPVQRVVGQAAFVHASPSGSCSCCRLARCGQRRSWLRWRRSRPHQPMAEGLRS